MQPAAVYDRTGTVVSNKGARTGEEGYVNSEKFWRKKIEDVPVDQMFFHKFFSGKLAQKEAAAKKKRGGEEESDEEDEEEAEDEVESDAAAEVESDEDDAVSEVDSDPEEAAIWKVSCSNAFKWFTLMTGDASFHAGRRG